MEKSVFAGPWRATITDEASAYEGGVINVESPYGRFTVGRQGFNDLEELMEKIKPLMDTKTE